MTELKMTELHKRKIELDCFDLLDLQHVESQLNILSQHYDEVKVSKYVIQGLINKYQKAKEQSENEM